MTQPIPPLDLDARPVLADARQALADATEEQWSAAVAEMERLRAHSITLNSIAWSIAVALGDVPDGATQITGDPVKQTARLIADRAHLRDRVERWRTQIRDLGNADLELRGVLWPADGSHHVAIPSGEPVDAVRWLIGQVTELRAESGRLARRLIQRVGELHRTEGERDDHDRLYNPDGWGCRKSAALGLVLLAASVLGMLGLVGVLVWGVTA
nr:hypothetical protein [Micromonospora sp. DSM 115978]